MPKPSNEKSFLVRLDEESHERIRKAAEVSGMSMADFYRTHALKAAAEVLDCFHPIEYRKKYPWAEFCTRCGMRLAG